MGLTVILEIFTIHAQVGPVKELWNGLYWELKVTLRPNVYTVQSSNISRTLLLLFFHMINFLPDRVSPPLIRHPFCHICSLSQILTLWWEEATNALTVLAAKVSVLSTAIFLSNVLWERETTVYSTTTQTVRVDKHILQFLEDKTNVWGCKFQNNSCRNNSVWNAKRVVQTVKTTV